VAKEKSYFHALTSSRNGNPCRSKDTRGRRRSLDL